MGQLVLASSRNVEISIEWRDGNLRVSGAIISNNELHNVAVQIYDDGDTLIFEEVFPPGDYTRNLPGSANRYVDIIEIAPGDFEYELNGFSLRLNNPA